VPTPPWRQPGHLLWAAVREVAPPQAHAPLPYINALAKPCPCIPPLIPRICPPDPCTDNQCCNAGSPGCLGVSSNYTCGRCRSGYSGTFCTTCAPGFTKSGSGKGTLCTCGANKYVKSVTGTCSACRDNATAAGPSSTTCGEELFGGGKATGCAVTASFLIVRTVAPGFLDLREPILAASEGRERACVQ
jgi:hypothetical protein